MRALLLVLLLTAPLCAAPGGYFGAELKGNQKKARVSKVDPRSPAQQAGLKPGDRILKVDGTRRTGAELKAILARAYPRTKLRLKVDRGGEAHDLVVTLGTWSAHHRAAVGEEQGTKPKKPGDAVILAGRPFSIGAPVVVTFRDRDGYDGYAERCAFKPNPLPIRPAKGCNTPKRYGVRRKLPPALAAVVAQRGLTVDLAAVHIDQVVIHYDVAWTSRNCFKVLHDIRGLSCHFLLDVDGTLYQTLDLVERARHAGAANDRSIGIEIAHPGPLELTKSLAKRYTKDKKGVVFDLGKRLAPGVRQPDFKVRPARNKPVKGEIQGRVFTQYDFTDEQYETLIHLMAGLSRILPRIRLAVPRDAKGKIRNAVMTPAEVAKFSGLLGHYHVSRHKQDPGPAFDWERLLKGARKKASRHKR